MSLAAGRQALREERKKSLARPSGSWWSPVLWVRLLIWHWRLGGAVTPAERRGYLFWGPTIAFVFGIEILGALSDRFRNWIPWPTISSTVGHLEKRWDLVAVIVVGLISAVAFHALAARDRPRAAGRTLREDESPVKDASWYSPPLVFALTLVAFVVPWALGAGKYQLGYTIYGTLAVFGIVVPSTLSFGFKRLVPFPTLFFTVDELRHRLYAVALVLVAGLAVLTIHLALYPWPDIAHESARFAGLNPEQARQKATRELRARRAGLPPLTYSTQARDVVDGSDTWAVYFRPGCVVHVTKTTATTSPECAR